MVIYIDVLFLVNFIVDYLLLSLTAYLRGNETRQLRLLLSSCIGGLAAVALFFTEMGFLPSIIIKLGLCAIMCLCAFGFTVRARFIGDCLMLFVASFIFAGAMIAVSQILGHSVAVNNTSVYFEMSFRILAVGASIAYFIMTFVSRRGSYKQNISSKQIICRVDETDVIFNAFEDSGNMAFDPISGKKIIMVSPSIIMSALGGDEHRAISNLRHDNVTTIFEELAIISPSNYGITPFRTVGGNGLMITVKPEKLFIEKVESDKYILGISSDEIETVNGCKALIGC